LRIVDWGLRIVWAGAEARGGLWSYRLQFAIGNPQSAIAAK